MLSESTMVAIEWRVSPSRIEEARLPIDQRWTRHSYVPIDEAQAEVERLTEKQSESGLFEFRVDPSFARRAKNAPHAIAV